MIIFQKKYDRKYIEEENFIQVRIQVFIINLMINILEDKKCLKISFSIFINFFKFLYFEIE